MVRGIIMTYTVQQLRDNFCKEKTIVVADTPTKILELDLSGEVLDPDSLTIIVQCMNIHNIQSLNLNRSTLPNVFSSYIMGGFIGNMGTLRYLTLSGAKLLWGPHLLGNCYALPLETLDLSGTSLNDWLIKVIVMPNVDVIKNLRKLNLDNNNISDAGAAAIERILWKEGSNQTLTNISIANNPLLSQYMQNRIEQRTLLAENAQKRLDEVDKKEESAEVEQLLTKFERKEKEIVKFFSTLWLACAQQNSLELMWMMQLTMSDDPAKIYDALPPLEQCFSRFNANQNVSAEDMKLFKEFLKALTDARYDYNNEVSPQLFNQKRYVFFNYIGGIILMHVEAGLQARSSALSPPYSAHDSQREVKEVAEGSAMKKAMQPTALVFHPQAPQAPVKQANEDKIKKAEKKLANAQAKLEKARRKVDERTQKLGALRQSTTKVG